MVKLVVATVPGNPAAVRGWNWTGWSGLGCYHENRGSQLDWGQVRTRLRFHFRVPTTLARIKHLNSHRIAIWSIRGMCRMMPCFISHSQICDRINIHWVALKLSQIPCQNDRVSIATQRLLIWFQIGQWGMKEGITLHISHIDYVAIRWELQYLIVARNVDIWEVGLVWKPVATVQFQVGTGPGTEPGIWTRCYHWVKLDATVRFWVELEPEPKWEFGPVANTIRDH